MPPQYRVELFSHRRSGTTIMEVLGWNLDRDTGFPDRFFMDFLGSSG
jgi:hypothetical protein